MKKLLEVTGFISLMYLAIVIALVTIYSGSKDDAGIILKFIAAHPLIMLAIPTIMTIVWLVTELKPKSKSQTTT